MNRLVPRLEVFSQTYIYRSLSHRAAVQNQTGLINLPQRSCETPVNAQFGQGIVCHREGLQDTNWAETISRSVSRLRYQHPGISKRLWMYGSWAGHLCYYRSYFHWVGALIVYSYVIIVVPVKPRGTHFVPHASETPHRSCVKLLKIPELSTVCPKGLGYRTYRMHRTRARQEDTSNGSIQNSNPSHLDNTRCNHSSSRSWSRSSSGIRWVDVIVTYGLVFESCLGLELFHPTYILYYRQNYEQLHQTIRIRDL